MEKYLNCNGTRLWSMVSGKGIPLILCNGGPGCDDYLGPVAEMLEDRCTIVRFEQRGCGRSDWDKQYDLDTTISDIDFVRQAYGFDKVIIAGHSAGVDFSLVYALRYPKAVLGVIGIAGGRIVNDRDWHRIYREGRDTIGEDNGGKVYTADPEVNAIGNKTWKRFIKSPTLLHDISKLDVPTVFINAGNDIRPNWPTKQLAHLIRNAKYVEIAGATHHIWITHPTELRHELQSAVETIAV